MKPEKKNIKTQNPYVLEYECGWNECHDAFEKHTPNELELSQIVVNRVIQWRELTNDQKDKFIESGVNMSVFIAKAIHERLMK